MASFAERFLVAKKTQDRAVSDVGCICDRHCACSGLPGSREEFTGRGLDPFENSRWHRWAVAFETCPLDDDRSCLAPPELVEEHDFLTCAYVPPLHRVPLSTWNGTPHAAVSTVRKSRHKNLPEPGVVHCFQISRKLPFRCRKSDHLDDCGFRSTDSSNRLERGGSMVIVARELLLVPTAKRVERGTCPVDRAGNPEWSWRFLSAFDLPPMVKNVNSGIRR